MGDTNNHEQNIKRIREALGNPEGCRITYDIQEFGKVIVSYIIEPQDGQRTVSIDVIDSIDNEIFKSFNIQFKKCIFKNKILSRGTEVSNMLNFYECIFEQDICLERVTFTKGIRFNKSVFKGEVDCKTSNFHGVPYFSETVFEQQASFCRATFRQIAAFNNVEFLKDVDFSGTTLKGLPIYMNANLNGGNTPVSKFPNKVGPGATFENGATFDGSSFHGKAIFKNTSFHGETSFSDATFKMEAIFSSSNFKQKAQFKEAIFDNHAHFDKAKFSDETKTTEEKTDYNVNFSIAKFNGNANFDHAELQAENDSQGIADFSKVHFKERAHFTKTHFYKMANFSNVIFDHNAYFDEAEFLGEAKFKQSEFYKNAHFYETKFKEFPNFIQAIFNENVNFTNTELNVDFDKTRETIGKIYTDKDKEKPERYKIANELRDSFRTIKSALIKDNNMLDASNYHRVELYCKELELELKKKENRETSIRDVIDRIQLYCYRLTSDHHTDLLLILNNVIFLIALFGVANFVLLVSQCDIIQLAFLKINYIKLLEVTICIIYVSLIIYIMLNCCSIIHFVIFLPIFSLVFYLHPTYVIFMVLTFCVLILCLMLLSCFQSKLKENLVKQCIFGISYFIVILMFIFKPSLLIPILGKLIEDKSSKSYCCDDFDIFECCLNTTSFASETLNLIYMLFLFLLLWSLQKTARKNTIVPN